MSTATPRVINAPNMDTGPVPAYKIIEYNQPWEKEVSSFDEKTRTIEKRQVVIDKGFLVVFPRGHALLLEQTEEALRAHGFAEAIPLVNMGNGDSEVNKDIEVRTVARRIHKSDEV